MNQLRAQRQGIRRAAQFSCEVVRDEGFSLLGRRVLDISDQGLRVALEPHAASARALQVGEKLWVSFRLDALPRPNAERGIGGIVFDYEAEIARVSLGLREGDDEPSLGIALCTRWESGRAYAPALSRLLVRNGIAKLRPLVAPRNARGARKGSVPSARVFNPLHMLPSGAL